MNNFANIVKFNITITSIYESVMWFLISLALIYFSFYLGSFYPFIIIPSCLLFINLAISKISPKKILMMNNSLIFRNGIVKYKLDEKKMRICYEKVSVWGGNFKDYYGLVLYRDVKKIIGFSFNNKFVLTYEMDEIKLAYYRKEFQSKFGIEINTVDNIF